MISLTTLNSFYIPGFICSVLILFSFRFYLVRLLRLPSWKSSVASVTWPKSKDPIHSLSFLRPNNIFLNVAGWFFFLSFSLCFTAMSGSSVIGFVTGSFGYAWWWMESRGRCDFHGSTKLKVVKLEPETTAYSVLLFFAILSPASFFNIPYSILLLP